VIERIDSSEAEGSDLFEDFFVIVLINCADSEEFLNQMISLYEL
jgi:hypothetical protein